MTAVQTTTYIYVDHDEDSNLAFTIPYPGTLAESGRAIQEVACEHRLDSDSTAETARALLHRAGIAEDASSFGSWTVPIPPGEAYWMLHTRDDLVCLGCGAPEFLEWGRHEFASLALDDAECCRLVERIRAKSRCEGPLAGGA